MRLIADGLLLRGARRFLGSGGDLLHRAAKFLGRGGRFRQAAGQLFGRRGDPLGDGFCAGRGAGALPCGFTAAPVDFCAGDEGASFGVAEAIFDFFTRAMKPSNANHLNARGKSTALGTPLVRCECVGRGARRALWTLIGTFYGGKAMRFNCPGRAER